MSVANIFGFTSDKEVAARLATIQPEQVSPKLRKRLATLKQKEGGFTLLELLVVISIIAVLGGLAIGAFGDKTSKAAKSTATHSMAALDSAVRGFQATNGVLPSNLDTLVCANADATLSSPVDYGGGSDLPGVSGGIGAKLAGKLDIRTMPAGMVTALYGGGIGVLRYGMVAGADSSCDSTAGAAIAAPAAVADLDFGAGFNTAGAVAYPNGALESADIPMRGFDFPISATGNRGRSFAARIGTGTTYTAAVPVQVWGRGANGTNNTKVGAGANDVLLALGLGNNSTIVTDAANSALASTAYYADVGKDKYGRYLMLVKVGTATAAGSSATQVEIDGGTALSKAKFIAMVDPRGDFLDEEYAESTGQKL